MKRLSHWVMVSALHPSTVAGKRAPPGPAADFAAERERMVNDQLVRRGIHDPRVLAAMRKVPREEFVPAATAQRKLTADGPLPIGRRPNHFAAVHRRRS